MSKGIALVTGAAQGIGQAIALRLANDGFDVALNDIPSKKEQLDTVAQEVNATGHKALVVCADVSIEDDVAAMIKVTVEELGGLDVMVANAGISGSLGPLVDSRTEARNKLFAINARGVFLCYKHAAKQMIAQGRGGRIIGASSAAGKRGFPLNAVYCASKFAVRGLSYVVCSFGAGQARDHGQLICSWDHRHPDATRARRPRRQRNNHGDRYHCVLTLVYRAAILGGGRGHACWLYGQTRRYSGYRLLPRVEGSSLHNWSKSFCGRRDDFIVMARTL